MFIKTLRSRLGSAALALVLWLQPRAGWQPVLFFSREHVHQFDVRNDRRCRQILRKHFHAWSSLPNDVKSRFVQMHREAIHFGYVQQGLLKIQRPSSESVLVLQRALRQILGQGIIIEELGSLAKYTAGSDCDFDLQVRRITELAHKPFTRVDKRNVVRHLQKLDCITGPIRIGNVAIKFKLDGVPVDLVLATPRAEEFPKLRGGEDFYENSERINTFLGGRMSARRAIITMKNLWRNARPKGLLLETIVWRLSNDTFPILDKKLEGDELEIDMLAIDTESQIAWITGCRFFFDHLVDALKNWEQSSFGRDLKQDLAKLPVKKQKEHLLRLEKFRRKHVDVPYEFLVARVITKAQRWHRPHHGPFELYLEQMLWQFFPFDL